MGNAPDSDTSNHGVLTDESLHMTYPITTRDRGRGPIGFTRAPRTTPGCLGICDEFDNTQRGVLVAQAGSPSEVSVSAVFDQENGVIWTNENLLMAIDRARKTESKLGEKNIETLTHEFAHVWQHRDVFEKYRNRGDITSELRKIALALRQQIAERVKKSTESQFIEHYLDKEKEAEKVAYTITAELRRYHGSMKPFWVHDSADTWFHNMRNKYEKDYRGLYRKTKEQLAKLGDSPPKVATEADKKKRYSQKLLPVYKMIDYGIFPDKNESITLHNLLQIVRNYNAVIVVSEVIESK